MSPAMKSKQMTAEYIETPQQARAQPKPRKSWVPNVILIIIGIGFILAGIGVYDLYKRATGNTTELVPTVVPVAQPAAPVTKPTAAPTATSILSNLPSIGKAISGLAGKSHTVDNVECTAVNEDCGSMALGKPAPYTISMRDIDANPVISQYGIVYGKCAKCIQIVQEREHRLGSKVPPGYQWEQDLYDICDNDGGALIQRMKPDPDSPGNFVGDGFECE